ncbi:MAG: hypothetical protein UX72_C0001G0133 [Parcubacteria group bacterium GW2011_GWA2_47_10]|nr:MAG: hypothetical protein UX72_C0001G0133 [Parcubacteria group bacterium GW2011_GWA2_47_10]
MENEQKQTTVSSETSTGGQPQGGGFSSSPLSVPVSIVIAGAIIALAVVYSGGTRQGGAPTAGQQAGEIFNARFAASFSVRQNRK